jgi:phosphoribosyl-AMP cyclohydrolase / phosphoribosyl-ATP pyrophosphohydrolase
MLIPSIDLSGGRAVQLRQGRELVLVSDRDPLDLAAEFNRYGEVAVIDLDAALGRGDNLELVKRICRVADVRAGGGIRTGQRGAELLRAGARRIIVGTAATRSFLSAFPPDRVIVALDHRQNRVVDHGWTRDTGESVAERAARLAPFCGGFLVTFVEDEGGMRGIDFRAVEELGAGLGRPLTVAGGVSSTQEAAALLRLNVDVQVGMALYTGRLDPAEAVVASIDFEKSPLVPTVVQDATGQVLMLAYSSRDSLVRALREGRGVYFSRSRGTIWTKGETSGNRQQLLRCRADCDKDALLFTIRQEGAACHTGQHSCFEPFRFDLHSLFEILENRKEQMPEQSYSARLFRDPRLLARKVMEEAFEAVTAGSRGDRVWEIADLLYFTSALAVSEGVSLADIEAELGGRNTCPPETLRPGGAAPASAPFQRALAEPSDD